MQLINGFVVIHVARILREYIGWIYPHMPTLPGRDWDDGSSNSRGEEILLTE